MSPNANQPWTFPLLHSTDGGKTFAALNTVSYASFVAFGKGPDANTPDLYVFGRGPGDTADAIYRSEDMGGTWMQISDPARMGFGEINGLEGDMRTRDLVYVALGGRGIVFGYGGHSGISLSRLRTARAR